MIEIKSIYKPIFQDDYSILCYYGGRSSGKSYGVGDSAIILSRLKKLKFLICRETKESMEKSILALYKSRIEYFGYKDFIVQKDLIKNTVTGSVFYFIGLNDSQETFLDSIKSIPDIDICIIEEAQSISQKALNILIPTIKRNAKGSKLIAIWNPKTKDDPIWELVEKPRPRTLITNVNYTDNTFCPPETIEEAEYCRINKPEDYAHIWLGTPRDYAENTVVKYFNHENISEINYFKNETLYLACDFNVDPMMWVLAHKTKHDVFFFDEIVLENCSTNDTITEFLGRYGEHKGNIIVNGDASGDYRRSESDFTNYAQIMSRLYSHFGNDKVDLEIRGFNPPIKSRVNAFNQMILSNKGERHLFISPKCKYLLMNCKKLVYKEGTSIIMQPTHNQIKQDTQLKFLGHIFDAASYLVEYYHPIEMD